MRRWRTVVIDDNPEGSLEATLLAPLVLARPLPHDASPADITAALKGNLLNAFLPLPAGDLYANAADVDFQARDFEQRRKDCHPRRPIIEVEREFARAWRLIGEFATDPPDIVFLDVLFEKKTTPDSDVEVIVDELMRSDRIGPIGRPTVRDIMNRGGLYLLGKLLRNRGHVRSMPLIVLYSASRDVQADFRPFEYASDGRFEVVDKNVLHNNAERRKQVFRRRISDYFMDGTVRPDEVRGVVTALGSAAAIRGDQDVLMEAFGRQVGPEWCFGALFVAESVAYLSAEPNRRLAVVEDLEKFIAPLVSDARSFVDLMESSPARLYSHVTAVRFSHRPKWLDPALGESVDGTGQVQIGLEQIPDEQRINETLQKAVQRLPARLRSTLEEALENIVDDDQTLRVDRASLRPRVRTGAELDKFVKEELHRYDWRWEQLLARCRMKAPVELIAQFLREEAKTPALTTEEAAASSDVALDKLQLFLRPSEIWDVKEPLMPLLRAIVSGMRRHAYGEKGGPIHVRFSAQKAPTTLEIAISDVGSGFVDVQYYEPHGRAGDLSTALLAAVDWFEVEIHSNGFKRRAAARSAGVSESSTVTRGTTFVIRVPAFHLQEG